MKKEKIKKIKIDELKRLIIYPSSRTFEYIYRAAMEVHWDEKSSYLFSPTPRERDHYEWYLQINAAAKSEYGIELVIDKTTIFENIPEYLKSKIFELVK